MFPLCCDTVPCEAPSVLHGFIRGQHAGHERGRDRHHTGHGGRGPPLCGGGG